MPYTEAEPCVSREIFEINKGMYIVILNRDHNKSML